MLGPRLGESNAMSVRRPLVVAALLLVEGASGCAFLAGLEDRSLVDPSGDDASSRVDVSDTRDGGSREGEAAVDANSIYRDLVISDRPRAYWRMPLASADTANVADESGNDFSLAIEGFEGGAGDLVGDVSSGALRFVETRTRASASSLLDFSGTSPFTLEVWTKDVVADGLYRNVFSKNDLYPTSGGGREQFGLYVKVDEGWVFGRFVNGEGRKVTVPLPGPLSSVAHLAATYDGALLQLFVNGVAPTAPVADTRPQAPKPVPLFIGSIDPSLPRFPEVVNFTGTVDEVAVYDRALDADRVKLHFTVGSSRK